jgi:hypothetical protein
VVIKLRGPETCEFTKVAMASRRKVSTTVDDPREIQATERGRQETERESGAGVFHSEV